LWATEFIIFNLRERKNRHWLFLIKSVGGGVLMQMSDPIEISASIGGGVLMQMSDRIEIFASIGGGVWMQMSSTEDRKKFEATSKPISKNSRKFNNLFRMDISQGGGVVIISIFATANYFRRTTKT